MTKQEVVDRVEYFAREYSTAPWGVIVSKETDRKGRKFTQITFGISRLLDCSVMVYGPKFVLVRSSRGYGNELYPNFEELAEKLREMFSLDNEVVV